MAFPSTFLDLQNDVIKRARLHPTNDLQSAKDWINRTYFDVCVETEALPAVFTATLIAGTARYSLSTTASGVNALNSATVNVADTSFFPAAGIFVLNGVSTSYTGKTATSFTGCGNHAATTGGETLAGTVSRIRAMVLKPSGQTAFNPPLIRTTIDELMQRRQASGDLQNAGDSSTHYTLLGATALEFWPTPAAADTVSVYCSTVPVALSASTDAPILDEPYATNLLVYGASAQAGDFKGDPATADWQANFDTWMQRYLDHLAKKPGVLPGQFHIWGADEPGVDAWG